MLNRSYKDSLFRFLFGQEANKEWLVSLYNVLNNSNYTNANDIELNTIQDILYLGMKNDISFIIQDNMMLLEHQSTVSENITIRFLLYYAKVLEAYIKTKGINIYRHTSILLPNPKFIVLYNGLEKAKTQEEKQLKKHYTKAESIDLKVEFYNLNKGHNEGLKEGCEVLKEYCWVNDQIVSYRDKMELEEAVELMYENLPEDFTIYKIMMMHKAEVRGMVLSTYDREKFGETMYEDGVQQGRTESKQEIAKNMKAMGLDENLISKVTGLSEEEIKRDVDRDMVLSTFDKETFGKTRFEDGYEEGIQIGVQQGEQRGRTDSKKEIAKNMKSMGLDENLISEVTGLSKKEIKEM